MKHLFVFWNKERVIMSTTINASTTVRIQARDYLFLSLSWYFDSIHKRLKYNSSIHTFAYVMDWHFNKNCICTSLFCNRIISFLILYKELGKMINRHVYSKMYYNNQMKMVSWSKTTHCNSNMWDFFVCCNNIFLYQNSCNQLTGQHKEPAANLGHSAPL